MEQTAPAPWSIIRHRIRTDADNTASLEKHSAQKITIAECGSRISRRQFLTLLASSEEFRTFFNTMFAQLSYKAFRWETPMLSRLSQHKNFECVVLNAPDLLGPANRRPFAKLFASMHNETVASFPNLGNDALMVIPKPLDSDTNYSHIGLFCRGSPLEQRHALWQLVGECALKQISEDPFWLNTAGGGVAWLHVRLDQRPKYYQYDPYKQKYD